MSLRLSVRPHRAFVVAALYAACATFASGPFRPLDLPLVAAAQGTQVASPWTMRGDVALVFVAVTPAQVAAFEAGIEALKIGLSASEKPERQRQRAGWRVYRQVESTPAGGVGYLFLLDPVVPGADYSVATILAEAPPSDPTIRPAYVASLMGTQTAFELTRTIDFGEGIDPETLPPEPVRFEGPPSSTTPIAGTEPRTFSGDLGVLLMRIDPDVQPDFEAVLQRVGPALANSLDPQRRRQAVGWRYFTPLPPVAGAASPTPKKKPGEILPVTVAFVVDPPVPWADYSVSRIVSDAFPEESASLFKTYRSAFVGGVTLLNFTLMADLRL